MKNKRIIKGFDLLAPVYTRLTRVIFGDSIEKAQLHFLKEISANDHVLILGGGPGNFLQVLLNKHPGLVADYIDISPKMLRLAKQKIRSGSNVNFIVGTECNIPNRAYSVVITYFYLDLFSDSSLDKVVSTIKGSLKPEALWLAADFINEKLWHQIMLWFMYRFFTLITHIEATRLPHWKRCLTKHGAIEYGSKNFFNSFIVSSALRFE